MKIVFAGQVRSGRQESQALEESELLLDKNSTGKLHGSLNATTEHHPTMRYLIYNCHSKVMSNSPKMGHLPIPELREQYWKVKGTVMEQ